MQTHQQSDPGKPTRKHHGKFGKRMKFNDKPDDVPPSEAYINSVLGSTLGHQYSVSSAYRLGNRRGGLGDD